MSEAYRLTLDRLRREIEIGGARPAAIDLAVAELFEQRDERFTGDLLMLLSDSAEYDAGMFSLIHAAEACDERAYVRDFLVVYPRVMSSAPRWASIVLMRVLNSSTGRSELVRQLRDASPSERHAIRDMCGRINEVSPEFLSRTVSVMVAASRA